MKHLKLFQTEAEYTAYKNGSDFITPNVSYAVDGTKTFYNPLKLSIYNAGDIVYYVDGNLETVPYVNYDASMGTAVGVIVVPDGFAPDGKARMVSLKPSTTTSIYSDPKLLEWGRYGTDTTLTNYTMIPTTDNVGSTTTGSADTGYLPSDNFSGTVSVIDPAAKYSKTDNMIPSPYLNSAVNPDYYGVIEGYNNTLSDFNGSDNTATLVGLGSTYIAANAANNYSDGVSEAKWYLPAAGELGYLVARFKEINNAIVAAGGVALPFSLWSSTEYDSDSAYFLSMSSGGVNLNAKSNPCYVRSFAIID